MPTDHESYLAAREKWTHEDNLLNHRLTWLLLTQTILFATYGVLMQVAATSRYAGKAAKLILGLPWFGMVLTALISAGIVAAISAQQRLKAGTKYVPHVSGAFTWIGYVPPLGLPLLFIVAWLLVLTA